MKILVTGGAGFIGSHVVDMLIDNGHSVVVVDDLSTGKKVNIHEKAEFHQIDILSDQLSLLFEGVDVVIHQAAHVKAPASLRDPVHDAKVNILGSLNVLECCRKKAVKKIIYANSAADIGNPVNFPIDENHPVNPLTPYGVSKHTVEHYLRIYSKMFGLKYVSFRFPNVYGPRQDDSSEGGVVAIFAKKLLQHEAPTILGDGHQTRDFVFVKDIAEAHVYALNSADNESINLGSGRETSIRELFQLMRIISGSSVDVRYVEKREGDIVRSVLSCEKAATVLGWRAKTSLRDGLKMTLEMFRTEI